MAGISLLLLSLSFVIVVQSLGPAPRALQWSLKTYGPDGPWHAISLQIGTPPQDIHLFPGGFWQSDILSSSICESGTQPCYASSAGVFDPDKSSTHSTFSETGLVENSTFEDKGMLSLFGSGTYTFDSIAITTVDPPSAKVLFDNFDMLLITEGQMTLPDGSLYDIEVGNLALGAPNVNQSWNQGGTLFNSTLLPSSLYLQGQTPSNSFGMHIGSMAMPIPPSLYIGGYDQTRVLGNVSVQDYNMHYFPIDLLDIGIGVAKGLSPFEFTSKQGLLTQGNSSIGVAMQVIVEPTAPYLYLPKSTCDAITHHLPVTYNPSLGLYFWDTTSAKYQSIITSPSYLSFTFRLNASISATTTINVPFSLLNLTLTQPLVASPVPYFPCTPFDFGKSYGLPTLGRAFLQAAFLGVNWGLEGDGAWFLAQAPGPNTPSQPVAKGIGLNDKFILPSTNDWAETWKESWAVIETFSPGGNGNSSSTLPSTTDNPKPESKLSLGIIAVIVGSVILVLGIAVIGAWFFRKKKRRAKNASGEVQSGWGRSELDTTENRQWETHTWERRVELNSVPKKAELDVYRPPMELPG